MADFFCFFFWVSVCLKKLYPLIKRLQLHYCISFGLGAHSIRYNNNTTIKRERKKKEKVKTKKAIDTTLFVRDQWHKKSLCNMVTHVVFSFL